MFNESLPMFVRNGRASIIGHQPAGWHFIAADDYAAMVSKAYVTPGTANKTLYVYGPESYTLEEALRIYAPVCEPEAKIATIPFWVMAIVSWFPGQEMLRSVVLPLMRYFSAVKEPENASAEANELLGAPTTTLQAWCEERKGTGANK